jgi:methylamine dehydrogenase heavy chain
MLAIFRLGHKFLRRRLTLAAFVTLISAGGASAQLPTDQTVTLRLPEVTPHWVYVLSPGYPSFLTSAYIVDGDSMKFIGMLAGGLISNFELAPDHHELYTIDTFYSRFSRGERTDVVSIFAGKTLEPLGEVVIPPKRMLVVLKRNATGISSDGRFLMVTNFTPATSISVVDLKARKFAGEIDTPGCMEALIAGSRRFNSICSDGSLLTVDLDESGKATNKKQGHPFFNVEKDPVFEHPAMMNGRAYFVSYHGKVYPADLSAADPRFDPAWGMVSDEEASKGWRPGGWQLVAGQAKEGLLYVLMHQGGEWTHKQAGSEVWVFGVGSRRRISRIVLPEPGDSVAVSQDAKPLLFVTNIKSGTMQVFSAETGAYRGKIDQLGVPFLVYNP